MCGAANDACEGSGCTQTVVTALPEHAEQQKHTEAEEAKACFKHYIRYQCFLVYI